MHGTNSFTSLVQKDIVFGLVKGPCSLSPSLLSGVRIATLFAFACDVEAILLDSFSIEDIYLMQYICLKTYVQRKTVTPCECGIEPPSFIVS